MANVGAEKTLKKMQLEYWLPAMRRYVKRNGSACLSCFYTEEPVGKKPGFLYPIEKVAEPLHTLHVDHLGPFVKSTKGIAYLIVAVDAFTKFVFLKPVSSTKALFVERFLTIYLQFFDTLHG